jgi:hypothetical protein
MFFRKFALGMKKIVVTVCLLLCGAFAYAQRSYIMVNDATQDIEYLKEKSRQAGLDLGLTVLANRIPTDSKWVGSKPSKHLLKQGMLNLQLPIDDKQSDFAVYHSELFEVPTTINVLQIDDELIVYRTMETTGNIHLLYECTRGAFGTKKSAHAKNAPVYKLWDSPERSLLPDLELQNQMARTEARKLSKTDYPLLILNDLKSYGYEPKGDTAIAHFLDTMQKYNPEKKLQGDLLSPASGRYLSQVNENQLWNAAMRTKMVETLAERQDYYRKYQMPWMIGNFQIHLSDKKRSATTMEELEWFLSKAAAFDAGFGLEVSATTLRKHGLSDEMMVAINTWETLRQSGAFSEAQKEAFKDPYGNWHIEKEDTTYLIYPQHISRRYLCHFEDDIWQWNSPYASRFALRIAVEGKGSISGPNLRTPKGTLFFDCTVKAGQYLMLDFDGTAYITDLNYNKIDNVDVRGEAFLEEGETEVEFTCEMKREERMAPMVSVRYITRGNAECGMRNAE